MKKKKFVLLLTAVLVIAVGVFAAIYIKSRTDVSNVEFTKAQSNGLFVNIKDEIKPDDDLTRAQMTSIINKALGTSDEASLVSYTDVKTTDWYYDDMAKAVHIGVFVNASGELKPDGNITREEVFVVLARAFELSGADESILDTFTDKESISSWAKDAAASMISAGYFTAAGDKLEPQKNVTAAEFAGMMNHFCYVTAAGTYAEVSEDNVIVNVPGVILSNLTIPGDLIIGDGVGDGEVTLDGVIVTGRLLVRGGGVNSVRITGNSNIQNIIISRVSGQVRVYSEDGTQIGDIIVDGSDDVIIEGKVGSVTIVSGDITVTAVNAQIAAASIQGEGSQIIASANTTIEKAAMDGKNTAIITMDGSVIRSISANGTGASISGTGAVGIVMANADNIVVTTPGTAVTAAADTTGITAGNAAVAAGSTVTIQPSTVPGDTQTVPDTDTPVVPVPETEPAGTSPAETVPKETVPAQADPIQTVPLETLPAGTVPAETQPVETLPAETLPAVTEPTQTLPIETEPTQTLPVITPIPTAVPTATPTPTPVPTSPPDALGAEKTAAIGELNISFAFYIQKNYSDENWALLIGFRAAGESMITDAIDIEVIYSSEIAAENNMAGVITLAQTQAEQNALEVGDEFGGGIVAYILASGDSGYDAALKHGLIAAEYDQSAGIVWSNIYTAMIGVTSKALGTGQSNTSSITELPGCSTGAAYICSNLEEGGYSDWFLPSPYELNKLYLNKLLIGGFSEGDICYWSSYQFQQSDSPLAWMQDFTDGGMYGTSMADTCSVRAVRTF